MIAVLLGFIKDQLHPPVKMHHLNVVYIFRIAVTRMSHIPDHIAGRHDAAHFQFFVIGKILSEMRIIIVPLPVKTADARGRRDGVEKLLRPEGLFTDRKGVRLQPL